MAVMDEAESVGDVDSAWAAEMALRGRPERFTDFFVEPLYKLLKASGDGLIVNISSTSGKTGLPLRIGYAVSKHAVMGLTETLAREVGPDGIRVNCLSPGGMLTQRIRKQSEGRNMHTEKEMRRIPLRRFGDVEDCANVLEFLVTPLSGYVTGQCISVCGGAVLTPS